MFTCWGKLNLIKETWCVHVINNRQISGAPMEVNISHRTRQQILNSADLAHPNLFKIAIYELLQLIKTVSPLIHFTTLHPTILLNLTNVCLF